MLVELSQLYMGREGPFEPIEECMIKMGGLECEILTFLGKHEHGIEAIGVLVDESDDFIGEGQNNHTLLMFWTHLWTCRRPTRWR